ncbi:MAG: acylphosphatase [Thermoguttaceae bacterium]
MIQRIYHFFGNVQGVGFRYTTCSIARNFSVTGYVRNRSDGSVELVIEGKPVEIDRFLDSICTRMDNHIDRVDVSEHPATDEFSQFDVR